MQNQKFKTRFLIIIIALYLILPNFWLVQAQGETSAPQTVEEAKEIGIKISERLPDAVKTVWWNEALPILRKTLEISIKIWNKTLGPVVEPWLRKELEKRRPALEQEFQKERKEMEKDLWDRFKNLLRESI